MDTYTETFPDILRFDDNPVMTNIRDLRRGDMVDLEDDSAMGCGETKADGRPCDACAMTAMWAEYELAVVDQWYREIPNCYVVNFNDAIVLAVAANHQFKVVGHDTSYDGNGLTWSVDEAPAVMERGHWEVIAHFGSHDECAEYIETQPNHHDGRYGINGPNEDEPLAPGAELR